MLQPNQRPHGISDMDGADPRLQRPRAISALQGFSCTERQGVCRKLVHHHKKGGGRLTREWAWKSRNKPELLSSRNSHLLPSQDRGRNCCVLRGKVFERRVVPDGPKHTQRTSHASTFALSTQAMPFSQEGQLCLNTASFFRTVHPDCFSARTNMMADTD